jgi:hypothetical protein
LKDNRKALPEKHPAGIARKGALCESPLLPAKPNAPRGEA